MEQNNQQWEELGDLKKKYNLAVARTFYVQGKNARITILFGGLNHANPKAYMDYVVSEFVDGKFYNEYIDSNLDNPWLRIIIEGVNDMIN